MNVKIVNLTKIPDGMKAFAKYMDEGEIFYSRCHFIAICDDGSAFIAEIDECFGVVDPTETKNCIGVEVVNSEGWLSAEEFHKKYKPEEYFKFKIMED